ncbi:hypothetical protein CVH13_00535, partial [Dehalococcoides mccartyi]
NAEIWNNKGLAYAALGKYQDALQSFNKALGIQPDFADALQNKENMMGKLQRVTMPGTTTPEVTESPVKTLITTMTPSHQPTEFTGNVPETGLLPETTVPVASKTTYSPVSPVTALAAVSVVAGMLLWANSKRT